jgi:hypothetical protein
VAAKAYWSARPSTFSPRSCSGRIRHGSQRHVRSGQTAGIIAPASDPEVRQQDSLVYGVRIGDQNIRGLDVAVREVALMGIVERIGHRGHDPHHLVGWHAVRVLLDQHSLRVGALDVVHGDPQLAIDITAVVHLDDVRMPQRRRDVGLAVEAFPVLRFRADLRGEHLERVAARQPGMLGQIDLAHPTRTERSQNRVSGDQLAIR